MTWFRVDDGFPSHPKVLSIPRDQRKAAVGLWLMAGTWSARHLTDGVVPAHMVDELGGDPGDARALLRAGLWKRAGRGYRFHNWSKYQPTRADVEEARKKEADRKAAYRAGKKESTPDTPARPSGSPPPVPAGHRADTGRRPDTPSRPVPSRPGTTQVSPSSDVSERESYPQGDEDDESNQVGEHYWAGLGISNPDRVKALLVEHVDRPFTDRQTLTVVLEIISRSKQRIDSPQAYVEGSIRHSWAEIQQQYDETAVAA